MAANLRYSSSAIIPGGVMVAQQILVLYVGVQVLPGKCGPFV